MELKIYKSNGKATEKSVVLNPDIYCIEPNNHAIYLDVKSYLANQRQGTAKTKERSDLSGSTRKLYRQKGTGNARRGDIKSPLLRGGARVFGPKPRDYEIKVNKKVKVLARKSALTNKAISEDIAVIENVNFENPKTKSFIELINNFDFQKKKILLVLNESNNNVILSTRNLQNVRILSPNDLNTYQILWANKMIITEDSIKTIEDYLLNTNKD